MSIICKKLRLEVLIDKCLGKVEEESDEENNENNDKIEEVDKNKVDDKDNNDKLNINN